MKSSLSSPMTAISAPVASFLLSLSLSGIAVMPPGIEKRPRPKDTRPEALTRRRCPFRTTSPLLVQPLLALSARTATLIVKNVGGVLDVAGGTSVGLGFETVLSD